jgi:cation diffusion facilitator CzcD-associated flavoprotein CzcO
MVRHVTERDRPSERVEVAVVGGGPGGLSVAAVLKCAGFQTVVFEREAVGNSWRNHYDRLHLHTVRWFSNLPGLPFPRNEGKFVSRDGVIRHLERYVEHHALDVRLGVEATRIDRSADGWRIETNEGAIEAWAVVVATGYNRFPVPPDWPGLETFEGEVVLASDYRNPAPFRGRRVLVVGAGNSGAEIAVDLVEGGAVDVELSFRTPPNITLRDGPLPPPTLGIVLQTLRVPLKVGDRFIGFLNKLAVGDLSEYGFPPAPRGVVTQMIRDDVIPIIDVGLIAQVKARKIRPVPAVVRIEGGDVVLADGSRTSPDVIVACIGYARGLEPLVGHLGVVGENKGRPVVRGGHTAPNAPRLYFVGYRNGIAGMFREFAVEGRQIARSLRRCRRKRAAPLSQVEQTATPAGVAH